MRIVNETRGTTLAADVTTAGNASSRMRGLMLRTELAEGEALDLRGESAVHTLLMRFPIDAVFYDGDGRVTRVVRDLQPWRGLARGGKGTRGVIELPAGAAVGCEVGDQLRWES